MAFDLKSGNSTPFKMMGSSPAKIDINKILRTTESISKKKKLPTFRKGDISVSQYDKEGNKLYNLVDAEGSSADYKNRKDQQTQTTAAKRPERMAPNVKANL